MERCHTRPHPLWSGLAASLVIFFLLAGAGCQPMVEALPLEEIRNQPTSTPTPNPTLLAVARMLTETAAAPTATDTPSPTPTRIVTPTATVEVVLEGSQKLPAPAGQTFILGDIALRVLDSQTTERAGRLKAQEGQTYLDLEILLENRGPAPVSYTPYYLRLAGPGKRTYQPAVDSLRPGLLSGTLQSGEWVRGHIAFAIPGAESELATGDFKLVFRPELGDLPAESGLREAWIALLPPDAGMQQAPETAQTNPDLPGTWPVGDLPGTGQRVESGGVGLTVTDAAAKERVEFGKAEKGNRFIVLQVEIDNVNHPRLPYNPLYFRVKDQAGYEYLPTAGSPETSLQAGTLYPDRSVTGQLIFEVPLSDGRLLLSFQPTVLGENYEEIRIELEIQ